ncbi:hypothetical protein C8F04DRAFT_1233787 [Mycena alexandri]|uniref:Uncharacterized protein n=1 Tax=Mycena alexandri TaxID=1745969 RepID=A0AAD6X4D2_9AGAR|nr:hypothetical protein C8F04DRAFT_1233787 [Mycena alexandri]
MLYTRETYHMIPKTSRTERISWSTGSRGLQVRTVQTSTMVPFQAVFVYIKGSLTKVVNLYHRKELQLGQKVKSYTSVGGKLTRNRNLLLTQLEGEFERFNFNPVLLQPKPGIGHGVGYMSCVLSAYLFAFKDAQESDVVYGTPSRSLRQSLRECTGESGVRLPVSEWCYSLG